MRQDSLFKTRKLIRRKHGGLSAAGQRPTLRLTAPLWLAAQIDTMDDKFFPAGKGVPC
jgi:hypothetical protein